MNTPNSPHNEAPETKNNITPNSETEFEKVTKRALDAYLQESRDNIIKIQTALNGQNNAMKAIKNYIGIFVRQKNKSEELQMSEDFIRDQMDNTVTVNSQMQTIVMEFASLQRQEEQKMKSWFDLASLSRTEIQEITNIHKKLTLDELKQSIRSAKVMKELYEDKGLSWGILKMHDVQTLISDLQLDMDLLTSEEKQELVTELENFAKFGRLNKNFAELILQALDQNDPNYRDKIAWVVQKFFPTLTIKELIKYNLIKISDVNCDKLLEEEYERLIDKNNLSVGIYDKSNTDFFTSSEYKQFCSDLINGDWQISTEDIHNLDNEILKKFAENGELKKKFAQAVEDYSYQEMEIRLEKQSKISTLNDLKIFLKDFIPENDSEWIQNDTKFASHSRDWIDDIDEEKYLTLKMKNGSVGHWKILTAEPNGVTIIRLNREQVFDEYQWSETGIKLPFNYSEFAKNFLERIDESSEVRIETTPPPSEKLEDIITIDTRTDLKNELDAIDKYGKDIPLENGMIFTLLTETKRWPRREYLRLESIDDITRSVVLQDYDGNNYTCSWQKLVDIVGGMGISFARVGKIDNVESFAELAKFEIDKTYDKTGPISKISGLKINKDRLCTTHLDTNGKETDVPVWGFKHPEEPKFIQANFQNGYVEATIYQYKSDKDLDDIEVREEKEKKFKNDKKAQEKYERQIMRKTPFGRMSYEKFMQLINDEKSFEPVVSLDKNQKHDPNGNPAEQYEKQRAEDQNKRIGGDNSQMHWQGFFSRLSQVTTIGDFFLMGKMIENSIEHMMESNGKLRAATALYNLSKNNLGKNNALTISMLGEFTNEVSKLIDWKMDYIRRLKWGVMRKEIRKILTTKPPKPIDILAAGIVILESTGVLYPDAELSDLQGERYIWFEQICLAIGLNPKEQMKNCYAKVVKDNPEAAHHVNEIDLIERMMKNNQAENPYIQAIGGGSKFWNAPKKWREEQLKKWQNEASEKATASGRAELAISKMKSNEFEIALGALEKLQGKSMSPDMMGVAFVWTASNAPNVVHQDTLNKFKNLFYEGNTFHALCFGKNKEGSDLYKNILRIAIREYWKKNWSLGERMWKDYEEIQKLYHWSYKHDEELYSKLWSFWKKYHEVLHPIMQTTDPTLANALQDSNLPEKDANNIRQYYKMLGDESKYFIPNINQKAMTDWQRDYNAYGVENSFMYFMSDNPPFRTLAPVMSNISFDTNNGKMSGETRGRLWTPIIIGFLKYLRDNPTFANNEALQREQFRVVFKDVMEKIIKEQGTIDEKKFNDGFRAGTYSHLNDLQRFGFDVDYNTLFHHTNAKWEQVPIYNDPDHINKIFEKFKMSASFGVGHIQSLIHDRIDNVRFSPNDPV